MIGDGKTQVFANVPEEYKERLDKLKDIDKVLYSNSRVVAECIGAHLKIVELRAQSFKKPSQESPSRRRRKAA